MKFWHALFKLETPVLMRAPQSSGPSGAVFAIKEEPEGPDWRSQTYPVFEDGSCAHRIEPAPLEELKLCTRCGATTEQQIAQMKMRGMESYLVLASNKTSGHGYGRASAEIFAALANLIGSKR